MQKYQQHPVFPGGHPSKYYPGPTMLNFGDRTRTGVFIVAVTHPSTIRALRCLTSVIGREPVFSSWYGRWHL
ncbi:hypothetical protein J437_LFUL004267 [Ladona fulva]|uniref:Uncharacterized protein n=1 Tax=Ladona fulva TaxID=123851 RepID=A0A8K0P459_LADFU|nr:hypothetical protein J437_LFUL004267 [Ladona fulva]